MGKESNLQIICRKGGSFKGELLCFANMVSYSLAETLWVCFFNLDWMVQASRVQTWKLRILIHIRGCLVYHYWVCTLIYCQLSYPLRSLDVYKYTSSSQRYKGIRQWPINSCTSPIMIHKFTLSVDYNQWLKHLDTQPNESTNQISDKGHKVVLIDKYLNLCLYPW